MEFVVLSMFCQHEVGIDHEHGCYLYIYLLAEDAFCLSLLQELYQELLHHPSHAFDVYFEEVGVVFLQVVEHGWCLVVALLGLFGDFGPIYNQLH